MKKTKVLIATLALSAALMGTGYAAWQDRLVLTNNVSSGELNVVFSEAGVVSKMEETYTKTENPGKEAQQAEYTEITLDNDECGYWRKRDAENAAKEYVNNNGLTDKSSITIEQIRHGWKTWYIAKIKVVNKEAQNAVPPSTSYEAGADAASSYFDPKAAGEGSKVQLEKETKTYIKERAANDKAGESSEARNINNKLLQIDVYGIYPASYVEVGFTVKNDGTIPAMVDNVEMISPTDNDEAELSLYNKLQVAVKSGTDGSYTESVPLSQLPQLLQDYYKDLTLTPDATDTATLKISFPADSVKGDELEASDMNFTLDINWRQANVAFDNTNTENTTPADVEE